MLRPLYCFLLSLFLSLPSYGNIAFRQLNISPDSTRPLNMAVWYPSAETGTPQKVGDNLAFYGISALSDAAPLAGRHPLLLLSHGYGGNWRNLNWLAAYMASQGYIVAAVDHPGTTTFNKSPQDAQQLWRRPQDLQQAMAKIIATPTLAGKVDVDRIAAVGHSLGGWTVIELAGGRFDAERFQHDCRVSVGLASCTLIETLGIDHAPAQLAADARDRRIKAVVSLDLGLARGFTPSSLAAIDIPVLVMSAQVDTAAIPAGLESGYLRASIPTGLRRDVEVAGATHFSFMQACKPGAEALIAQKDPGEEIVCQDGGTRSRAAIHHQLAEDISAFLNQALHFQPLPADTRSGSSR